MSKYKNKKRNIKVSGVFDKMQSGELILCGGSMFTDKENEELLKVAFANILNK